MKKINLLFSALMICLAVLVAGGVTVAPVMQAQALALSTASNWNQDLKGANLFDSAGRYAVQKSDLTIGATFNFFGYDWRVVNVNDAQGVATFWMADPYTTSKFDATTRAGNGIFKDGSNIWTNGYSESIWNDEYTNNADVKLGQSYIRSFLTVEAERIITNSNYKYKNKVVPGYVPGSNEDNAIANSKIAKYAFSKDSLDQVEEFVEETNSLTAKYDLNSNDILWLPSFREIVSAIYWNLPETVIAWTDNTASSHAWLRTPDIDQSHFAITVASSREGSQGIIDEYFIPRAIKKEAGVRPAIHLNIENIAAEYQDHLDNPAKEDNGGWFNDDWLKALFIVVCILGLVGIGLIIIAVIVKSHSNNADAE